MIARYLKYGNDCLLYQTVVLEDNIIITITARKAVGVIKHHSVNQSI